MEENAVQEKNEVKKGMPKQTLAFVAFLIVATLVLLGLAVYTQKPLVPQPTPGKQAVFPSYAHTTLKINSPVNKANSLNYTSDISIDTGENKVTGVQLELSYDPKVLNNVDIKPGSFIKNPVVLLKKVDKQNGRISLSIGVSLGQTATMGTGTIATVTFDEVSTATGKTILNFLPETTVVAQGTAKSVLKESFGSSFSVNQNVTPSPVQ